MKRKKKYKYAYKRQRKLMLMVGATTMAVGTVTMGQVLSVHAEETSPEPIVTELKNSSVVTEAPTVGEEGQTGSDQTEPPTPVEVAPQTEVEAGLSELEGEQAGVPTERSVPEERTLIIETSEQAAPIIADIAVNAEDEQEYRKANVGLEITFEQVEQPAVVTHKLINKDSGEAYVETATIEKRPHYRSNGDFIGTEIDTSIPETTQIAYAYFREVPAGTYRLEIGLTDLESKPYELDAASLEKINNLPDIVIKPYVKATETFVEPNLIEASIDKKTVKKGENVVYTLVYDSLPEVSYAVMLKDFDYGFFTAEYDKTGKQTGRSILRIAGKFSEAGEKKLEFDTSYGYFSTKDWKKQVDISEANRNKLAQLMPTVTVLDEDYKHIEITSLTHIGTDGSRNELAALDSSWSHSIYANPDNSDRFYHNRVLHKLQVGDQLVYKVKISPEYLAELKKKKSEQSYTETVSLEFDRVFNVQALGGTAFEFDERDSLYLSSDQWETGEVDLTFTVKDYMHGYLNLNRLGSGAYDDYHLAFGGYLFQIENPTYSLPTLSEIKKSDKIYVGENATIKVKTSKSSLISSGTTQLDFDIQPTSENFGDSFDYYLSVEQDYSDSSNPVVTGWLTGSLFDSVTEKHIGSYSLKRAEIYFDGWKEEITDLPNWTLEISGDKVFKSNFLLSGEERTQVGSIGRSWVYGSLGRLPKELQNRRLGVNKIQFYDRQGNNLPTVNADWVLSEYELREGDRLYYYLPSTGELTELKPVLEDGRRLVKGSKDSKGLYVFAMAIEEDGGQPTENANGTTKVLSGQVEDVYVSFSEADVSAVSSIQVVKVEDATVFEKLPESFKREDVDMFDIKTLDKDGQFVQIQSSKGAFVTLPVSPNRKVTKVIYYLPQTGAVEELEYEWDKTFNLVSFKVSHFSNYAIVYEGNDEKPQPSGTTSGTGNNTSPETGEGSTSAGDTASVSGNSASPEIGEGSTSADDTASVSGNNTSTAGSVNSTLVGSSDNVAQLRANRREEVSTQPTNTTVEPTKHADSKVTRARKVNALPNTAAQTGVVATVLGLALATLASFVQKKREE
ncbi:LPXTG cell wall anchor domain-containing protein [Streptococcus suis]|uniref:LPXTG cell wall anchor domain-containing protein n=1 Tax=Streptococcus suis TaxID=1307 RepID=UPI0038B88150